VVGARLAENGLGYLFPVFGLSYVINTLHMSREVAISGVMLGNFAEIFGMALVHVWTAPWMQEVK
jgi:MHS family shikimate/dehydroshikimate transporter-like MFS transporter